MRTVANPADNRVIGRVPDMSEADVNNAIGLAYNAFQTWKTTTAKVQLMIDYLFKVFFHSESKWHQHMPLSMICYITRKAWQNYSLFVLQFIKLTA